MNDIGTKDKPFLRHIGTSTFEIILSTGLLDDISFPYIVEMVVGI